MDPLVLLRNAVDDLAEMITNLPKRLCTHRHR